MRNGTKLVAATMFWAIANLINCLSPTNAFALEDRLAEWDCGHCQKLVQQEIGQAAFETQLAAIVADHDKTQRRWEAFQGAIQENIRSTLPVARQQFKRNALRVLNIWSRLNSAPENSAARTISSQGILPRTIAIQTLNNIPPTQWLVWQNDVAKRWETIQLAARIDQISLLLNSIYASQEAFVEALNLSVQWAAELPTVQISPALSSLIPPVPQTGAADEYWQYYADCDHWQVTFEIR